MVIVAAVDRSERARSVVEQAASLAEAYGDPVHVVHALSRSEFIDLAVTNYEEGEEAISMAEVEAFAADHAADVAEDVAVEHRSVGRVGKADDEVVRYAEKVDARYVVLAPRRRSPAGKALFGSVAQSVILTANCPVVTVIERDQ